MQASFAIIGADGETLGEEELASRFDELRERLTAQEEPEGTLVLYNDGGSYRVTAFRDDLEALMRGVCVRAIPDLAAGKEVVAEMAAYDESAAFKPEGDEIVVSGDQIDGDRCPARPLLEALVGCGERYLAFIKRLRGDNPELAEYFAGWDAAVARARASLNGA